MDKLPERSSPRLEGSDLLVVGISLKAGRLMSYSKSRRRPIAPQAVVEDPDRSVDSPIAGRKHHRPRSPRLTDNLKRKGPSHDASENS